MEKGKLLLKSSQPQTEEGYLRFVGQSPVVQFFSSVGRFSSSVQLFSSVVQALGRSPVERGRTCAHECDRIINERAADVRRLRSW